MSSNGAPVNLSENNRCWCPACDEQNKIVGIFAPWFSPDDRLVCTYVVCNECAEAEANGGDLSKMIYEIESNLLRRFPELLKNLPSDYVASPTPVRIIKTE